MTRRGEGGAKENLENEKLERERSGQIHVKQKAWRQMN
jgi:hypothetical protein